MKSRILIYALVLLMACKDTDSSRNTDVRGGIWILTKYSKFRSTYWDPTNFFWKPNELPLGFRFYSNDSAEVYRPNYYAKQERFVPYQLKSDTLSMFQSDSLGWWKRKIIVKGDSMYAYTNSDTIVYGRLPIDKPLRKEPVNKIVLAAGSSWGWIISAILYPNGKTLVTLKSRSLNAADRFFIKNTGALFDQLAESYYWVNQIQHREDYYNILDNLGLTGLVMADGDFSEMLLLNNDSSWFDHRSQMSTFHNQLLGLQGYAFNKIIGARNPRAWQYLPDSIACDSVRKMDFPICKLEGVSNHFTVLTLLSEAINSTNKLKNYYNSGFSMYFTTRSCFHEERSFYTNGKIVDTDSGYYNLGFNFIDLLQKHP